MYVHVRTLYIIYIIYMYNLYTEEEKKKSWLIIKGLFFIFYSRSYISIYKIKKINNNKKYTKNTQIKKHKIEIFCLKIHCYYLYYCAYYSSAL